MNLSKKQYNLTCFTRIVLGAFLLSTSLDGALFERTGANLMRRMSSLVTMSANTSQLLETMRFAHTSKNPWENFPMEAVVRDVRYDETFKILLGEEGGEHRTISFLNAVLNPKAKKDQMIQSIKFLDGSLTSAIDRTLHFDVKVEGLCKTYNGQRFIVEMQKATIPAHTNRWVYYGARELAAMGERNYRRSIEEPNKEAEQSAQRAHYQRLDPVKVVTILDFDYPKTREELRNVDDILVHWDICERSSKDVASQLLSWTYVILPRFEAKLNKQKHKSGSLDFRDKPLDAWLYLMTRQDEEKVMVTPNLVAKDMALAEGFYRVSHLSPNELESLRAGQMAYMSRMAREVEEFNKGKTEGKIEGEKAAKIEIARNLKSMNLSVEQIKAATGLTEAEINDLK